MGEYSFDTEAKSVPGAMPTFTHVMSGKKQGFRQIGFICGGSGITPGLQVAVALLADPKAKVKIQLLYACQSEGDLLCREEIEKLGADPRFTFWYTVDKPPEGKEWTFSTGFINEAMCRSHLPPPGAENVVFICGPPMMVKLACLPNLEKLGHSTENNVFCF